MVSSMRPAWFSRATSFASRAGRVIVISAALLTFFAAATTAMANTPLPASASQVFAQLKLHVWGCKAYALTGATYRGWDRSMKRDARWTEWTCSMSSQDEDIATRSHIAHQWHVDQDTAGQVYMEYWAFSKWPNGDLNVGSYLGLYGQPRQCRNGKLVLVTSIPALRAFVGVPSILDTITCTTDTRNSTTAHSG